MSKTKKEVEVIDQKEIQQIQIQPQSDLERIINAIKTIDDVEKIDKLLDLQKRHEDEKARKEYYSAMTAVQAEIPTIAKTEKNDQTHSKYAALDEIIKHTKDIYTKHGFSISFYEGDCPLENHIRILADISHSAGFRETKHYDNPNENTGIKGNVNMTKTHAKATATSYARRYLMCMIWNIPTGDDKDGNTSDSKPDVYKEVLGKMKNKFKDVGEKNVWMKEKGIETPVKDMTEKELESLLDLLLEVA